MKLNKFFLAGSVLAASLSLGSCVGDLDLLPTNPDDITASQFASDPRGFLEKSMADVYLQYATYGANGNQTLGNIDGGMTTFQRSIFILSEIPTDEANWLASNSDTDYGWFQFGIVPASNNLMMGTYSKFMVNVAICNQFMQTVNEGFYNLNTPELVALKDEFFRQARILRAAAYYYAIDNFGNVPWADVDVAMGQIAPQLSTDMKEGRRLVTNKVVADLEEIVDWYKENDPNNIPPYGYVGLDVAEALLVKFYLNFEVYTGTAAWDKCFDHAQAIIARLGNGGFNNSGLCQNYFSNFGSNNKDYVIGGSGDGNEIIWTIPQSVTKDGVGLISYANSTFMVNAWITTAPGDADWKIDVKDYNANTGWKCMSARPQLVEKFTWNEATMETSNDVRVKYWKTSKDGFQLGYDPNALLEQAYYGSNGYIPMKYSNWYEGDNGQDKDLSPKNPGNELGGDYAMIRLAEIYLSAAEAALNGAGAHSVAVDYVNLIRERAGLSDLGDINLTQLQDERVRELYTECVRRTDLVRYGKWISGYNWNWKGHTYEGIDLAPQLEVYPLPSTVVARNGYQQNPGY